MSDDYDQDNPWHSNANLILGFLCQYCDAEFYFDDVAGCEPDKDFGLACVQVSEEAQKLGWKLVEEFTFCCPACAKEKEL